MRVEAGVPWNLDVEAEGVVPLIGAAGLGCLPVRCYSVSAEEQEDV